MTKKERAQQIFTNIVQQSGCQTIDSTIRSQIIQQFIAQLDMTPAGAATYYAACKSLSSFGNAQPELSRPQLRTTRNDESVSVIDSKQLYTVCKIVDGRVASTGSYVDPSLIRLNESDVLVRGLPEIGLPSSKLQAISM